MVKLRLAVALFAFVCSFGLVIYGAFLVYRPAGFVVAGLCGLAALRVDLLP